MSASWGSAPDPAGGAYSAPPDPLAGFKGPTSKGREGRGEEGRVGEGKGGEGRGVLSPPLSKFLATPLIVVIRSNRLTPFEPLEFSVVDPCVVWLHR